MKKIIAKKDFENIKPVIDALENIKSNKFVKGSKLFEEDFQYIIERLKDDTFRLAVVGEFSSGKSTFLNALIGQDLLKHGAQETTATITEICNKNEGTECAYLDIYFSDGKVRKKVPTDQITEYTATASKTHSVAQEIDKVVINSNILDTDAKVCFVDTPGLNGIADNHREKTVDQIKNAHACIYLMQVRGLGESDIEFIKFISKYQHNIIFVQNFIDQLKKQEGETPQQKIAEQKRIIEEKIIKETDSLSYKIVGVSSRKALIARDRQLTVYEGEQITEEMRERLYRESCFDDAFSAINDLIIENEKEKMKQKDTVKVAIDLLKQLNMIAVLQNEKDTEKWEKSADGRNREFTRKRLESLKQNKEADIKKLDNYIVSESASIRKEDRKQIDQELQCMNEYFSTFILEKKTIEEFEKYVNDCLPSYMYKKVNEVDERLRVHIGIQFKNMVTNAIMRVSQYTGMGEEGGNFQKFATSKQRGRKVDFFQQENDINQIRTEMSRERQKMQYHKEEYSSAVRQKYIVDSQIHKNAQQLEEVQRERISSINRLGAMPQGKRCHRTETYYVDRGGLGIAQFFLGSREETKTVWYTDYTNQDKWKDKKRKIEDQYNQKEWQLDSEKRQLENKKKENERQMSLGKEKEKRCQDNIRSMENLLRSKEEYLKVQKEKAKQEYLRSAQNDVVKSVENYLQGTISKTFHEDHNKFIEKNMEKAQVTVKVIFENAYIARVDSLEKSLNGKTDGSQKIEDTSELLNCIEKTIVKLEGFLCQR